MRLWNSLREVAWFSVLSVAAFVAAIVVILLLPSVWALAILLALGSISFAVLALRT